MANSKCSSGFRSLMYSGKHALLPPKSPYPSVSPACVDYVANPNPAIASKVTQKPKNGNPHHQRTSSESLILEEQPSWLDDLLNEPETPVRKGGHRRSSSDSFAYLEPSDFSNSSYADLDDYRHKNLISIPSWASQDFDHGKDARLVPMYREMKSSKPRNRTWESSLNSATHAGGVPSGRDNAAFQSSGSSSTKETDGVPSTTNERHDPIESGTQETKVLSDRRDGSLARPSPSETDTKRAKQQFAQRSRVRKLQYIAELESNVQALQAEGSEVSAELEFLNQQHLILSMENKALKQRLESVAQEQLIKYLEQEMLEREIGRLRSMYQQQQQLQPQPPQQQQKPSASHRRTNSRDLESQFSNLSLKHKDANSGHDPMTGPLGI